MRTKLEVLVRAMSKRACSLQRVGSVLAQQSARFNTAFANLHCDQAAELS